MKNEEIVVKEEEEKVVEEPVGNGIPIEDLVTKDLLTEKLNAFESKLDSILKENIDLKEKLSKFVKDDFGNVSVQGFGATNDAHTSFDEYSKLFK